MESLLTSKSVGAMRSGINSVRLRVALAALVLFAAANLAGCGSDEFGPIGEVSGSLLMDGEPVSEGTKLIFMHPTDGHAGFGLTDTEGKFTIEWRRSGTTYNGLPVGNYEVMIVAAGAVDIDELTADEMLAGKMPEMPKRTAIPRKYLRASTSGLRYEVQQGENNFEVNISAK